MDWPAWWEWKLEISSHCVKRMQDRVFTEADVREMLADAFGIEEQVHGTFIVATTHRGVSWEVIVSPDDYQELIVVVTAYQT